MIQLADHVQMLSLTTPVKYFAWFIGLTLNIDRIRKPRRRFTRMTSRAAKASAGDVGALKSPISDVLPIVKLLREPSCRRRALVVTSYAQGEPKTMSVTMSVESRSAKSGFGYLWRWRRQLHKLCFNSHAVYVSNIHKLQRLVLLYFPLRLILVVGL